MATSTLPKNQSRIMKKIISVLTTISGKDADQPIGAATLKRAERKVWVCLGAPTSTAPTGMTVGSLILDITSDEVYRYITGTTYVNITADT